MTKSHTLNPKKQIINFGKDSAHSAIQKMCVVLGKLFHLSLLHFPHL